MNSTLYITTIDRGKAQWIWVSVFGGIMPPCIEIILWGGRNCVVHKSLQEIRWFSIVHRVPGRGWAGGIIWRPRNPLNYDRTFGGCTTTLFYWLSIIADFISPNTLNRRGARRNSEIELICLIVSNSKNHNQPKGKNDEFDFFRSSDGHEKNLSGWFLYD